MTILLVDSYDSFTYNLRNLVEKATNEKVVTVHNNSISADELKKFLPLFSAIIIGPGPGNPSNPNDVGIIPHFFDGSLSDIPIPILGICLGFQSLCLSHDNEVLKLPLIKHGQVYQVSHNNDPLFNNIEQAFKSVRYHSLYVPTLNDSLIELAWTLENNNEKILMAAKHKSNPWFGVQYHPESICSENGDQLINNFINIARSYNLANREIIQDHALLNIISSDTKIDPFLNSNRTHTQLHQEIIKTDLSIIQIADKLFKQEKEFVFLNSASNPGNWSIIGIPTPTSTYITHSTESPKMVTIRKGDTVEKKEINSIWEFISNFMNEKLTGNNSIFPFIGGFMGIFSYEEGQYINFQNLPKFTRDEIPDTKLVFIENCILQNNSNNEIFITSTKHKDELVKIKDLISKEIDIEEIIPNFIKTNSILKPDEFKYKELFKKCQDFLQTGDSYELCLTVPTEIEISNSIKPWSIYKILTLKNPSPYSAYFNFDDCVLISSSPERFIYWDKEYAELRPIKGTVKKSKEITFEKANSILNTPKEIGENLMIVDLIRHDLYELLNDVEVIKLMTVEEYSTVYQLVSVIRGYFKDSKFSGIDILSRSLPPGSMTGAPKKRSVEILQALENSRRGLYSGVCGYWSIENKADWSVIIRSLFHYKTDLKNSSDNNIWRIGAGGAITVLSDEDGEWDEMLTKLESALQVFI